MKALIVDPTALRAVSPQAIAAYAVAEGWKPVEAFGEHSQVFADSSGNEIIVPGTSALGDYEAIVAELIGHFARTENRGELQVYRDLASADRDVIRVRVPEANDDGSVLVDQGVQLFHDSRDLVLSAACAAWSPQRTYRAGKIKAADDYMSRVRLGQTEQGSFVVTLLAPVPPAIEPLQYSMFPQMQDEPFERKVTRRLAQGLDAAADAVEQFLLGAGAGAFERSVSQGVSANLCDAAARLSDKGDGVEISVTWARTRPTPAARWHRTFTRSEGEVLREVSRVFRERQPRPDEQVQGFIRKLERPSENADAAGDVTMKALVDDQWVSVRLHLEPMDYLLAIEAHRKVWPIQAVGTLERVGHRWRLSNPSSVQLAEGDEEEEL